MNGLTTLLQDYGSQISIVLNVVIGIVAIVFCGLQIAKAIAASNKKQMGDMAKHVGLAIVVALIAALGIGGVNAILGSITSDSSVITFDNTDNFSMLTD